MTFTRVHCGWLVPGKSCFWSSCLRHDAASFHSDGEDRISGLCKDSRSGWSSFQSREAFVWESVGSQILFVNAGEAAVTCHPLENCLMANTMEIRHFASDFQEEYVYRKHSTGCCQTSLNSNSATYLTLKSWYLTYCSLFIFYLWTSLRVSDAVGLEWGLRICISNMYPGDNGTTVGRTPLWKPRWLKDLRA